MDVTLALVLLYCARCAAPRRVERLGPTARPAGALCCATCGLVVLATS